MRIFFCTNTFSSVGNGPGKFANILLELNQKKGVDLHIITPDVQHFSDKIHRLEVPKRILSPYVGMLYFSKDYATFIAEMTVKGLVPDVIVFNNAITGIASYRSLDIPCIGMINDYSSIDATIKYFGISRRYLRNKIFQYFEEKASHLADKIVVNSNYLLKRLELKYRCPTSKIAILYKGVDIKSTSRYTDFSSNKEISISYVKSDWWRGGLDLLMKALASLHDYKFKLNVIGPPIKQVVKLTDQFAGNNITIINHGRLDQNTIFKILETTNIFCTPSRDEALGVANMEALLHKIPVVYSDIGGIPEVMDFGNNGFPCNPKDPISIVGAIKCCIEKNL